MKSKITGPHKATNYAAAFYEAQAFLTAVVEINKKAQSIISLAHGAENVSTLRNVEYVNHAFAVELLLKCIMIMQNGHYYRGHNLLALYEKLNHSTQNELALLYDKKLPWRLSKNISEYESITFKMVLMEGANAFMDLRYSFEPNNGNNSRYHLDMAADIIVRYIQQIKPELKSIMP